MTAGSEPTVARGGYRALLAGNRSIRLLWLAGGLSWLCDSLSLMGVFQLAERHGSGVQATAAILVLMQVTPLLWLLLGGWLADRFDRRRVLIAADLARVALALSYLLVDSAAQMPLLYGILFLNSTVMAVHKPTHRAYFQTLAAGGDAVVANALLGATVGIAAGLGAILGGVLGAALGAHTPFLVTAAALGVSVLCTSSIVRHAPGETRAAPRDADGTVSTGATTLRELLRADRRVGAMLLINLINGLGIASWVILVKVGQEEFRIGPEGALSVGILNAASAAGSAIGGILVRRTYLAGQPVSANARRVSPWFAARLAGLLVFAAAPALAMTTGGVYLGFAVALVATIAIGLTTQTLFYSSSLLLRELAPATLYGRVYALDFVLLMSSSALLTWAASFALDHGASASVAVLGVAAASAVPTVGWILATGRAQAR